MVKKGKVIPGFKHHTAGLKNLCIYLHHLHMITTTRTRTTTQFQQHLHSSEDLLLISHFLICS